MIVTINNNRYIAKDMGDGIAIIKKTGEIYSTRTHSIIATKPRARVSWYGVQVLASHLVAAAYLPEPEHPDMELHHIDGDPANNRPNNLVWLTKEQHQEAHRRMREWMREYLSNHIEIAKGFIQ